MKNYIRWMSAALLASAFCAGTSASGEEQTDFVVDSPFDLTLGSTEYAKRLGNAVHSTTSATYDPDTKLTTTNWSAYASIQFAKPYHGATSATLQFKGEDNELDSYSFIVGENRFSLNGRLTVDECRKTVREVADDISKRFGVKMEASNAGTGDMSDDEIDARFEDPQQKTTDAFSYCQLSGFGVREGVSVGYSVSGMVSRKRKCTVGVTVYTSEVPRRKGTVSVASSSIPGLVSEDEQKKAHEEAKGLRDALGGLFGIDFDSTDDKGESSESPLKWKAMARPVAGLVECRPNTGSTALFQVPIVNFTARRAYPGDVEESEMQRQAKEILDRIEAAYGGPVPEGDMEKGRAQLAEILGDGVPTFGDTRALLGMDKVQTFVGKVGDLAVEIAYALPRYERSGEDFRLVRRGAVVLTILQSPMITLGKPFQ